MNFKEWLKDAGISPAMFAKITKIDRVTAYKILEGMPIRLSTAKKLISSTRSMKIPLTLEIFKDQIAIHYTQKDKK